MVFSLSPANPSEKITIANLLQPYIAELSQFPDENPDYQDEQSIYLYPYLDAYWQEDSRYPYLLYADDQLAGFTLVRKEGELWEIAEFYVSPGFRRRGAGMAYATEIFRRHPGLWRIKFNKQNTPSQQLWKKLAQKLAQGDIKEREADISHDYISFSV